MDDFSKFNGEGTVLRKAQMREVAILQEVDKICRKHDIKYWIDFGTLLGAVRHGGFIPWDDDLDISMLSSDYQKFMEVAPQELPDWLFLQNKHKTTIRRQASASSQNHSTPSRKTKSFSASPSMIARLFS